MESRARTNSGVILFDSRGGCRGDSALSAAVAGSVLPAALVQWPPLPQEGTWPQVWKPPPRAK